MGQADYLKLGDWNADCSMCAGKFKASELTKNWQGMYRCRRCQEPRQPQDFVRSVPDDQSVPWVQPELEVFIQICSLNGRSAYAGRAVAGCSIAGNSVYDPNQDT